MISFAKIDYVDEIIRLWQRCFGDSREYIEKFLISHDVTKSCLIYLENGSIVSMLFLLEGYAKIANEMFSSLYIYAACTAPEYRGKGLMGRLIEQTMSIAVKEKKDYLCLVPANEGLFNYYARFGFKVGFKKKELSITRRQLIILSDNNAEPFEPSIEEITRFRNRTLSNLDCFIWDELSIKYAILENEVAGGKALFANKHNDMAGYAIYIENDEQVLVRELCAPPNGFGAVAKLLTIYSKSESFLFNLPMNFPLTADGFKVYNNGMIRPISARGDMAFTSINNAYIGLTLE